MNLKYLSVFFVVLAASFLVNNNLFTTSSRLISLNTTSNDGVRQIASVNYSEQASTAIVLNKLKDRKPAHAKVYTDFTKLKYEFLMGKYDLKTAEAQEGTKIIAISYIQSAEVDDAPIKISENLLISEINKLNKSNLEAQKFVFHKDSEGRLLSVKLSF
jgi:hypothetical protein